MDAVSGNQHIAAHLARFAAAIAQGEGGRNPVIILVEPGELMGRVNVARPNAGQCCLMQHPLQLAPMD